MSKTIIYHIDVNSAFLSWQACHDLSIDENALDIRTIPAVIGGSEKERHGIVLAKSISAKAYQIRTGEPLVNARKKYPNLTVIPPNFSVYVEYSKAFIDLLQKWHLISQNPTRYTPFFQKKSKKSFGLFP